MISLHPLLSGSVLAMSVMTVLWLVQLKTRNAGIVDIGWSLLIPALAIWYALLSDDPSCIRGGLAVILTCLWGGRLAWHIHRRSRGKPEDSRYSTLRNDWGSKAGIKMLLFFYFQALAAVLFSIPSYLIIRSTCAPLQGLEIAGAAVWFLALLGEATADQQLTRFKLSGTRDKVCQIGWWNYSRHPNYFFEWLIWVGTAIYALASPYGAIALICPLLMLFFLFKVTGIPATEQQALKSKGESYRRYQQTTSVFFPWFKKGV